MSKNILKKDALDFVKKIEGLLKEYGANEFKSITGLYKYELNTIYGRLEISFDKWEIGGLKNSKVYSIYTCFDDTNKIKNEQRFKINNFSGKCNFHRFEKEVILNEFEFFLKCITCFETIEINDCFQKQEYEELPF